MLETLRHNAKRMASNIAMGAGDYAKSRAKKKRLWVGIVAWTVTPFLFPLLIAPVAIVSALSIISALKGPRGGGRFWLFTALAGASLAFLGPAALLGGVFFAGLGVHSIIRDKRFDKGQQARGVVENDPGVTMKAMFKRPFQGPGVQTPGVPTPGIVSPAPAQVGFRTPIASPSPARSPHVWAYGGESPKPRKQDVGREI